MEGRAFQANGIDVKRAGGVSKFPLLCLLRQDVQNAGFASAFVPFYLGRVKFCGLLGHFKIWEYAC